MVAENGHIDVQKVLIFNLANVILMFIDFFLTFNTIVLRFLSEGCCVRVNFILFHNASMFTIRAINETVETNSSTYGTDQKHWGKKNE